MSIEVKVGQVWRDKDKRRNTVIEIIDVDSQQYNAIGLVVGTEKEQAYKVERLVKRWELVNDRAEIPLLKIVDEIEEAAKVDPEIAKMVDLDEALSPLFSEDHNDHAGEPGSAIGAPIDHMTREEYLELAVQAIIADIFTPAEIEVPPVRVSVGWPGGRGPKKNVIGQCFDKRVSKDGKAQIFVTPAIDDAYVTIETLTHELIHAIVEGHEDENGEVKHHGHRGEFITVAKAIGFEKPWKETPASPELREKLQAIADRLGAYPHAAITMEDRPTVQKTYYLKYVSPENSDYFVRVTATKVEEYGAPLDPWGNEMEEEVKP